MEQVRVVKQHSRVICTGNWFMHARFACVNNRSFVNIDIATSRSQVYTLHEKQDPEIDATTRIAMAIIAMNVLLERGGKSHGNKWLRTHPASQKSL